MTIKVLKPKDAGARAKARVAQWEADKKKPKMPPPPQVEKRAAQPVVEVKTAPQNLDGFDVKVGEDGRVVVAEREEPTTYFQPPVETEESAGIIDLRFLVPLELEEAIRQGRDAEAKELLKNCAGFLRSKENFEKFLGIARKTGNMTMIQLVERHLGPLELDAVVKAKPEEVATEKEGKFRRLLRRIFGTGGEHE